MSVSDTFRCGQHVPRDRFSELGIQDESSAIESTIFPKGDSSDQTLRFGRSIFSDSPRPKFMYGLQQFVAAMVDVGCSVFKNSGSAVAFKHSASSIVFHRPRPGPNVEAVSLEVMRKRLRKMFRWDRAIFVAKEKGGAVNQKPAQRCQCIGTRVSDRALPQSDCIFSKVQAVKRSGQIDRNNVLSSTNAAAKFADVKRHLTRRKVAPGAVKVCYYSTLLPMPTTLRPPGSPP